MYQFLNIFFFIFHTVLVLFNTLGWIFPATRKWNLVSLGITAFFMVCGKQVLAWAMKGNLDTGQIKSNLFEFEWPPKSGKKQLFPEIDKAGWFTFPEAKEKINSAQIKLLDELDTMLKG